MVLHNPYNHTLRFTSAPLIGTTVLMDPRQRAGSKIQNVRMFVRTIEELK